MVQIAALHAAPVRAALGTPVIEAPVRDREDVRDGEEMSGTEKKCQGQRRHVKDGEEMSKTERHGACGSLYGGMALTGEMSGTRSTTVCELYLPASSYRLGRDEDHPIKQAIGPWPVLHASVWARAMVGIDGRAKGSRCRRDRAVLPRAVNSDAGLGDRAHTAVADQL